MANDYVVNVESLTGVADAIRQKTGTNNPIIFPDGFVDAISGISSGSSGLTFDTGEFSFEADTPSTTSSTISHNLGDKPRFILVWTDDFAGISNPVDTRTLICGFVYFANLFGAAQRGSSTVNLVCPMYAAFTIPANTSSISFGAPTSVAYGLTASHLEGLTENTFTLPNAGASTYWKRGITYKYFVSGAWWNREV